MMIFYDFSTIYVPVKTMNENLCCENSIATADTSAIRSNLNFTNSNERSIVKEYNERRVPYLEERNMNLVLSPNTSFTLMPPPPHNIVYNEHNKNLSKSHNNSPQGGYDSDESCHSYNSKGRVTPDYAGSWKGWHKKNKHDSQHGHNLMSEMYYQNNGNKLNTKNQTNNYIEYRYSSKKIRNRNSREEDDVIMRRVFGLMERFTSKAKLFRINPSPLQLIKGDNPWDQLSKDIWDMYKQRAQTEETYLKKLKLWKKIFLNIQVLERYGLFLVGSTMSGLAADSSDVDMCLLIKNCLSNPRHDAIAYLEILKSILEKQRVIESAEIILAKVPILKFKDSEFGFRVDLNCNNSVGIRNTHLVHSYTRVDWRVRPLIIIVKLWAQANNINEAKNMTISSYSLVLMVIHYLQCGVKPPVIPCLQGLQPERYNEIHFYDIQEEDPLPNFKSDNNFGLGELFVGFLYYYTHFNYAHDAISVRAGCRIPIDECRFNRTFKNDPHQWKYLCIEEPFDNTNTARSVYDEEKFEYIKSVFRYSYEFLVRHKKLNAILPLPDNFRR